MPPGTSEVLIVSPGVILSEKIALLRGVLVAINQK
jgi:hypothetical protein